jgi:hypothetical protein
MGNNYIVILQSILPYLRVFCRRSKRYSVHMITDAKMFGQGNAQTPRYVRVKQ